LPGEPTTGVIEQVFKKGEIMSADLKYLAFTAILTAWIPDASKLYRSHATAASVLG
jgi:hypothetical protein